MIDIKTIGALAWDTAQESTTARVIGVTSRGVFLMTPELKVIFLSQEKYSSPLSVTFNSSPDFGFIQVGQNAVLSKSCIDLQGQLFSLNAEKIWKSGEPEGVFGGWDSTLDRLAGLSTLAFHRNPNGFGIYLPALCGNAKTHQKDQEPEEIAPLLMMAEAAVRGDTALFVASGGRLLGAGRGLTPSGDDALMGALLCLSRWRILFSNSPVVLASANELVARALVKTTAISANLLGAATAGQADERLITALDYVMTGQYGETEALNAILGYGGSSGVDALAGMAVVMRAAKSLIR